MVIDNSISERYIKRLEWYISVLKIIFGADKVICEGFGVIAIGFSEMSKEVHALYGVADERNDYELSFKIGIVHEVKPYKIVNREEEIIENFVVIHPGYIRNYNSFDEAYDDLKDYGRVWWTDSIERFL